MKNMKRILLSTVVGMVLGVIPAEARLGENVAQCQERYGAVIERRPASVAESDPQACIFSKSGITAYVEFRNGVAWRIVFRMPGMSPTEAETLLKANLPDGGWGPALKFNGQDFRLSADRRRISIYTPTKASKEVSSLEVASRDYGAANYAAYSIKLVQALGTVKERKTGKSLDGF